MIRAIGMACYGASMALDIAGRQRARPYWRQIAGMLCLAGLYASAVS